jgi:hypothetical protein
MAKASGNRGSKLVPVTDREQAEKIMDAIAAFQDEFTSSGDWSALDELSNQTLLESIEADPEGMFLIDGTNGFEATATVNVTLNYGDKADRTSFSDSYPAKVTGQFDENGKALVKTFDVDTSSFYD